MAERGAEGDHGVGGPNHTETQRSRGLRRSNRSRQRPFPRPVEAAQILRSFVSRCDPVISIVSSIDPLKQIRWELGSWEVAQVSGLGRCRPGAGRIRGGRARKSAFSRHGRWYT